MQTTTATAIQTKWMLDPSHSELVFKVKHLMIANVKGSFRSFSAIIDGEDFRTAPIHVTIEASSVFTNDDNRDGHLRAPDFFDVETFKTISFESSNFKKLDGEHYQLTGILTIKGISREVKLQVEFGGTNTDPYGNEKAGFSVSGSINRSEWGLNWNAALETGGVLVSDEVKIQAELQFVRKSDSI